MKTRNIGQPWNINIGLHVKQDHFLCHHLVLCTIPWKENVIKSDILDLHAGLHIVGGNIVSPAARYDWFSVILWESWWVPHWEGNSYSFRNTWFHSLWKSSWFHPFTEHYIICQFWDYVYGIMTLVCLPGLFATASSLDLFQYKLLII